MKQKHPFKPGDRVELIPDSYNPKIENEDWADEDHEDIEEDKAYMVEFTKVEDWRKVDSGDVGNADHSRAIIIPTLTLIHTESCGGSGYTIPAYRFRLSTAESTRSARDSKGNIVDEDDELPTNEAGFHIGDTVYLIKHSEDNIFIEGGSYTKVEGLKLGCSYTVSNLDEDDIILNEGKRHYWCPNECFSKEKPKK